MSIERGCAYGEGIGTLELGAVECASAFGVSGRSSVDGKMRNSCKEGGMFADELGEEYPFRERKNISA